MDNTTSTPSALSDDELLHLWEEGGGRRFPASRVPHVHIPEVYLLPFLRSFAERIGAEEQKRLAEHHVFHATCPTCGTAVDVIPALGDDPPTLLLSSESIRSDQPA